LRIISPLRRTPSLDRFRRAATQAAAAVFRQLTFVDARPFEGIRRGGLSFH
jgi:hypothetical protein